MRGRVLAVAAAALVGGAVPGVAAADALFTGRVALTGFFYTESDGLKIEDNLDKKLATSAMLGFGDLRLNFSALRLARGRVDIHFDARARLTGEFDFDRKFSTDDAVLDARSKNPDQSPGISARGYLGGREYDLREMYLLVRATDKFRIQLGRMFITEADNLKLDGLRLGRTFGPHWDGSVFGGLYSNPYSRSVLTDYAAPCAQGAAGTTNGLTDGSACQTEGFKFGVVAGLGARYAYERLWGNFGLAGSYFFGPGDGGKVVVDPNGKTQLTSTDPVVATLLAGDGALDKPRIFVSWMNSWRPAERVDILSDIVLDLYGSAGFQPTRAMLLGTIRLVKNDRLTLRLGYSHMSSLAIDMYLARLLYNRQSGTTLLDQGVSSVQNNLTVLRTGRDEGRVTLDSRIVRRFGAFVEGRVRSRFLINGASNPNVYTPMDKTDPTNYDKHTQNLAYDVSGGLRDTGSLRGIRGSLTYSGIFDFRATNHVVNFDIGRDFASDRFGFTVSYVLALTKDKLAAAGGMAGQCTASDVFSTCYGYRSGMTHEAGLQLTASPARSLFFLLDYRFIALLTDPQDIGTTIKFPPTLSHAILFRTEFRW